MDQLKAHFGTLSPDHEDYDQDAIYSPTSLAFPNGDHETGLANELRDLFAQEDFNVNAAEGYLLHVTIRHGILWAFMDVMSHPEVDVNLAHGRGGALANALRCDHLWAYTVLLHWRDTDVNVTDETGNALSYALQYGHYDLAQGLLLLPHILANTAYSRTTVLIEALRRDDRRAFDMLIAHRGIDVMFSPVSQIDIQCTGTHDAGKCTCWGRSGPPLIHAAFSERYGHYFCLRLLRHPNTNWRACIDALTIIHQGGCCREATAAHARILAGMNKGASILRTTG